MLTCEELDSHVMNLTSAIHEAFMQSCPNSSNKKKFNFWWNEKLTNLKKECRRLYRWYSKDSTK